MAERGEYRSIHTVLVDSPEFLALSPEAQLCWFHLRLRLGPTGIDSLPAAEAVLSEATGIPLNGMGDPMGDLIGGAWLIREGNVLWLRNALKYDPSLRLSNANHLKAIKKHLHSLPKLKIVNDFADYYGIDKPFDCEWDTPSHTPSHRGPMGDHGRRKTEDGIGKTETPMSNGERSTEAEPHIWMHDIWHDVLGFDGHPIKLTDERRTKYRKMYEEQLKDTPDPRTAWRAVLYAVTQSEHHMATRTYQMPESILTNSTRRDRWVQQAIDVLRNGGGSDVDRRFEQQRREVLDYLTDRESVA